MFCCVLSCRFSWFSLRVIYTVLSLSGTLFMTCLCVVRFFKRGCTFEETRKSCPFKLYKKSENFNWSNNIFKKNWSKRNIVQRLHLALVSAFPNKNLDDIIPLRYWIVSCIFYTCKSAVLFCAFLMELPSCFIP